MAYGSKRGFYNPKLKRVMLVNENHENLRTWQDAMRKSMMAAVKSADRNSSVFGPQPPIAIDITMYLARPKGHFKKDGKLSKSGRDSLYPTRKPDCDKVARAVADCGTGIWYADDAQIVEWRCSKRWAEGPGVIDGLERTQVEVDYAS
jgi:Holliday junction resolvase RusA-like endonuclease